MELFFDKLCGEYYEKILKYVYFNIKDESSARDITQDVFLIVYEKIEYVFKHPNIGGFIFQTAKNLTKQYKREVYIRMIKEINADENVADISGNIYDISSVIDSKINEFDFIPEVLDRLSDEKRNLYNLYYIKNMSMNQIASELGIEYAAVRMRYVRLRKEIKNIVRELAKENF